jgi:hypothetical protein
MAGRNRNGPGKGKRKKSSPVPAVFDRVKFVHELMGKYAFVRGSSDDFARQKAREIEMEH